MVPFDDLQVSPAPLGRSPPEKAIFDSPSERVKRVVKDDDSSSSDKDKLVGKTNKPTNSEIPFQLQPTNFTPEEQAEFMENSDTL